eukprot:COSAG03_NODE_992_length_5082_cov_16.401164_1_plen_55_part_00
MKQGLSSSFDSSPVLRMGVCVGGRADEPDSAPDSRSKVAATVKAEAAANVAARL